MNSQHSANPSRTHPSRAIVTSCGLIQNDEGLILLVHRRADRDRWPDLWDLPGGEALDDEDVDDTLVRELREELGIEVRSHEFLDTAFDVEPASGRRVACNIYAVRAYDGAPQNQAPDEHDRIDWVAPADLAKRGMLPAILNVLQPVFGADIPAPPIEHVDMEATWNAITPHYQAQAQIPTDRIHYGPAAPTEDDLRLLGDPAGKDVVEVGCGGGQNAIAFKKQGARRVVGVDLAGEQLRFARELARREGVDVEFVKARVEDLAPLPDGAFDAALSAYCFQYVQDLAPAMRAVHRVLRPGGLFAFSLDHPAHMMFADDGVTLGRPYFQRAVEWLWTFPTGNPTRMTAVYHTLSDLFAALREAGFVVESLLEPEPAAERVGNWEDNEELSRRVPRTVIFSARKPEDGQ